VAERLPKGEARFTDDEEFVYFHHLDAFYRVPRDYYERVFAELKAQTDAEHEDVVNVGGLHIIGTERHEARRIDNQLRGRAGRQGDPGSSRFYLSLEDDLMRIFGSDRIAGLAVEGPNKPGAAHQVVAAVAAAGINLRGLSATTIGRKWAAFLGFDSAADAAAASKAIKKLK